MPMIGTLIHNYKVCTKLDRPKFALDCCGNKKTRRETSWTDICHVCDFLI